MTAARQGRTGARSSKTSIVLSLAVVAAAAVSLPMRAADSATRAEPGGVNSWMPANAGASASPPPRLAGDGHARVTGPDRMSYAEAVDAEQTEGDLLCVNDASGDVVDAEGWGGSSDYADRADLLAQCVYTEAPEAVGFYVDPAEPHDPLSDSNWASVDTSVNVAVDVDGDGVPDFTVYLFRDGDELVGQIVEENTGEIACEGSWATDEYGFVSGLIPLSCLGWPTELSFASYVFYRDTASAEGLLLYDEVPDSPDFQGPVTVGQAEFAPPAVPEEGPPPPSEPPAEGDSGERNPEWPFDGDPSTAEHLAADAIPLDAALEVSRARFDDGAAAVAVLSRDDAFPDSLAGSPLSADGPLLLTPRAALDSAVSAELTRALEPGATVYLLGGEAALSRAVEDEVRALDFEPRRLAGSTRVETSVQVAREVRLLNPEGSTVAIGRADAWADSVTGGAWAAREGVPLMVTDRAALHPAVAAALSEFDPARTVLLGGTAALSEDVEAAVPAPLRVAGPSRAETAVEVAEELWVEPPIRYIVFDGYRDDGWAYGLPAGGIAADQAAPLLLAAPDGLADAPRVRLAECGVDALLVGPLSGTVKEQSAGC